MSSVSDSGGLHWTAPAFVPGLPSPNDQGSLLRGDAPAGEVAPLFFSGPYSKTARENISIVASYDDGQTCKTPLRECCWGRHSMRWWRAGDASVVAYPGAAKYSCLSALDSRRISLLIERHNGARSSFDIGESQFLPAA